MSWSDDLGATVNPVEIAAALAAPMDAVGALLSGWQPSNTSRLQASLRAAVAETGYSDHVFLGDGQTGIYAPLSSGGAYNEVWPYLYRAGLAALGVPAVGTGWVKPAPPTYDTRISETGTWSRSGGGGGGGTYALTTTSGATLTFTSDVAGTVVGVGYLNNSGPFTVTIDGGSPVGVTPTGAQTQGLYEVTGLSDTTHTVMVTTSSTTVVYINGFKVDGTSGLRIHNFATYGGTGAQAYTSTDFGASGFSARNLVPDPDVVHIALGFIDAFNSRTVAQFESDLATIAAYWPDADLIFYVGYQGSGRTEWPRYAAAIRTAAQRLSAPVIDVYAEVGDYTAANGAGYMTGSYYPSATGAQKWADIALAPLEGDFATRIDYLGDGSASQKFTTPALGTPVSGNLKNCTGHTMGEWRPDDYGTPPWKAWTYDPLWIYSGAVVTAGYQYMSMLQIPYDMEITNLIVYVHTLDGGLTSGQCFASLYQGGTKLGSTASQHTAWSTTGVKEMPISGGAVAVTAGTVQVGFYANGNTVLKFGTGVANTHAAINFGLNRSVYTNSTYTTTPPASLGAVTGYTGGPFWVAVS